MGIVVIVGGHGKIARLAGPLLRAAGHTAVGLVRNPGQSADLAAARIVPQVLDLERTDAARLAGVLRARRATAVLFAAGAGAGASDYRRDRIDRAGAIATAEAAHLAGVRRVVQISSLGADAMADGAGEQARSPYPPEFLEYLRAKWDAEQDLRGRDLDWTIVRPATLTDEPGTGRVVLAERVPNRPVPREDVAAVLVKLLDEPSSYQRTLELCADDGRDGGGDGPDGNEPS
jgi:uncharacterized protein YbjT (DUF2867 family)